VSDPIDKTLDEYLSGNSQVSQRYRELDDAAVPPQLDQLVLARARAAVADRQSSHTDGHSDGHTDELERLRRRRKRLMRWSVPAGLAASAVLVVSIVMQSGVQHEVVSLPQQPARAPAAVQEHSDRSGDRQEGLVVLTQPSAPPPVPMMAPPDVLSDAPLPQSEMEKVESNAKRTPQQQSSPLAVKVVPELANEPAFAPTVAAPATLHVPEELQRSTSNRAISSTAIEQTAATQQAAESRDNSLRAAAEASATRKQQTESRRAETPADYDLSEIAVTGNRARRSAPASGPRGTVRQSTSAESQPDATAAGAGVHEEPKHWLERIRQLRKDGKAEDADREWQRFREAYPDYAVAETDAARTRP
jgi:hypothetical protein